MSNQIDLIHAAHLKIIAEIQRICRKHGIRYFVESGTLLGAIRHKAAIPWDDDADTAMLRSEFEKFRKVVRQELSSEFQYVEPADVGGNAIFDLIPRVVLLHSQVREDSPEEQFYGKGIYNHVVVDIFIIDDMSDSDIAHAITKGLLLMVYGFSMGHRYKVDTSEFHGITKAGVRVLSAIGKLFPASWIIRWYDSISRMGEGKNKKKHRCYYGNFPIYDVKKVFDKNWFAKDCTVTMSGQKVNAPAGWHDILVTMYHNYMELPPEEERSLAHCSLEHVKVWDENE